MKIEIKSGFKRGGSAVAVTGTFPEFEVTTLASAGSCTWKGDTDTSCSLEVDDEDARAIFETWFLEALGQRHSRFEPLTSAARAMANQPLPKGWGISIPGTALEVTVENYSYPLDQGMEIPEGGVVTFPGYDRSQRVTIGTFLDALVAGDCPTAWPPEK